jgi:hypothetical protein
MGLPTAGGVAFEFVLAVVATVRVKVVLCGIVTVVSGSTAKISSIVALNR